MSPECEPIPKPVKREKAPRRGIARVGKKTLRDRAELDAVKPVLLERSKGRCEAKVSNLCTGIGVHAHHVRRRAQSGSNDLENLLWVCAFCHDLLHHRPALANELGMIEPSWTPDDAA